MRLYLLISLLLLILGCISSREKKFDQPVELSLVVFEAGQAGYSHYRIPSLAKNDRYLMAFAEARKNSVADNGDIGIVLRRSSDGGSTWGDLIRVVEVPGESLQNPVAISVEENHKWILLFSKRTVGADTESMIRSGTSAGYVGVYQVESLDDGLTWSEVKDITSMIKKDNWRWYALGPGGAIRVRYDSRFSGRIIVPANHSTDSGSENEFLGAHVIYSDDGGASWEIGAVDSEGQSTVNPNETTVVELKKDALYFNTRNQFFNDTIANRAVALSRDGGLSFAAGFAHEPQLKTPVVHASLTRNDHALFFFAPFDQKERKDLSMWRSEDEGKHWQYDRLIYQGPSAYSSACLLSENVLGLLIETDAHARIIFKRIEVQ